MPNRPPPSLPTASVLVTSPFGMLSIDHLLKLIMNSS